MIKRIFSLLSIILALCSCENINYISPIPDAPVSFTINILRDAPQLMSQGNSITITEPKKHGQYIGYSGLLIYHDYDDKFYAFDLCCPYEHQRDIKVVANMHIISCPNCGSKYDVSFGSMGIPFDGPTKDPLKKYTVTRSGDYLRITK